MRWFDESKIGIGGSDNQKPDKKVRPYDDHDVGMKHLKGRPQKDVDGRTIGHPDEHCKKPRISVVGSRSTMALAGATSKRGHVLNSNGRVDRHNDKPVRYATHSARPKF